MRAEGFRFNLHHADARRRPDLRRKFETVFAGELIEHIDGVHGFLTSTLRHLAPGGQLILTTPNAFYIDNFVYSSWNGAGFTSR